MNLTLILALFISHIVFAQDWQLKKSQLTYQVKHLVKTVEGTSTAAKGIAKCDKNSCDLLIAAPIASFDSKNPNRDAHMQQVMKAATYPMVKVRLQKFDFKNGPQRSAVTIEIAGKSKSYELDIHLTKAGDNWLASTNIPLKLSDFDLERPSLVTVKIEDNVPVKVETEWMKH